MEKIARIFQLAGGAIVQLNQKQAPEYVWDQALNLLATAGKLSALCDVLERDDDLKDVVEFQDAIRAVRRARPAVERRFFDEDNIVLDRQPLRALISSLESHTSRVGVIVVRGDPKSGRSHGRLLYEQAAQDGGVEVVYACAGLIATVDQLIDLIRVPLQGKRTDITDRSTTTGDAWYQSVCMDLLELAQRNQKKLWITVDDLGFAPDNALYLPPDVRVFCEQFAMNMTNPLFRNWFRLLLIDYQTTAPTKWKSYMWREDVPSADDIGADAMIELLNDWASTHAVLTSLDLKAIVAEVLSEIGATPIVDPEDSRLQRLNDSLTKRIRSLQATSASS